jgi:hypothetical protein
MRPVDESQNFMVATDTADGKVRVMINAWDKDDQFLDFLNMTGSVVGPDMNQRDIDVRQIAPGRYLGEFEAADAGSYMILVNPGRGKAPIRTGINVPYSAEYRDREENLALLTDIAGLTPAGGKPGLLIEDPDKPIDDDQVIQRFNSFRHDLARATSPQDIWHLLLLVGGCLFFFDVFFRRVQISFQWLAPLIAQVREGLFQREPAPVPSTTMARLQSRKAEVSGQIQQRRAAARFEPTLAADQQPLDDAATGDSAPPQPPKTEPGMAAEVEAEEDTYTGRLLEVKRKAREQQKKRGE